MFGNQVPPSPSWKLSKLKQKSSLTSLKLGTPPPSSWKQSKHKQNKKFLKKFEFEHDPPPFLKKTETDFSPDGFPK